MPARKVAALLEIENGEAKEVVGKPRSLFHQRAGKPMRTASCGSARGHAREDSGLFDSSDPLKPIKVACAYRRR